MTIKHSEANYRPTGLSHYDGNPLIEALPPFHSDKDLVGLLANYPELPTLSELALPSKFRSHCLVRLNSVVLPLEIHKLFELRFAQVIRGGYVARHPFSRDTIAMRHANSLEQLKFSGFKGSAKNLTLVGLSGMGKTTMLDAVVRLYPQVIEHKSYQQRSCVETQVTWLKIECPHDGSPRGFCASFFAALDEALGSDYSQQYLNRTHTISMLLDRMTQLCRTYWVGALIIDEFQHLNLVRESGDRFSMLNFFVKLSNDSGVPIVYSGTNAMFNLFSGVVRNARRALGSGEFYFDRFDRDDAEWELLVEFLLRYNWTGKDICLDERMYAKIYDLSQGNTDFLVKLLTLAQGQALYEDEAVTPELLQAVYDTHMTLLHKAIAALRSGREELIKSFEDLMPAKDHVARMMNGDLTRRVRRVEYEPAPPTPQEPVKRAGIGGAHLVGVPDADVINESTQIAQSASWEDAMKEKGWVADVKDLF